MSRKEPPEQPAEHGNEPAKRRPWRLIRTRGGRVVHREACSRLTGGITSTARAWLWADVHSDEEVLAAMDGLGTAPCRYCEPFTYPDDPFSNSELDGTSDDTER